MNHRLRWNLRDHAWALVLLLPALVLLIAFCFYPLANVIRMSMQGTDIFGMSTGFVGIRNYRTIFTDPDLLSVLGRTLLYALVVVLGRLLFGYLLALLVTRKLAGMHVIRFLITSPVSVSIASASLGFTAILGPTGLINHALSSFGLGPFGWLTDPHLAFPCVIFVTIWTGLGFTVILIASAMEGVDPEILEASRLDGANEMRIQWSMVIPLITPTLFYIAVTAGIEAFTSFAQINILTHGGPGTSSTTIVYNIYTAAFGAGSANFGIASALGAVLFVFVFILTALEFRVLDRKVNY